MGKKEKSSSQPKQKEESKQKTKDEGKYLELENAVDGQVVVRFPPEASGYLHIGHAKAALLNAHYQQKYHGKLVFRFDDTNPEKEKESFEKIIEVDVELLGIRPNLKTYTSDYFDLMLQKAEQLINDELAYVDDTDPEQMKAEREQRIESKNRSNSVEQNLKMWKEMIEGSTLGQTYCLRAKINIQSDNGALRDPTIYRCKPQEHPRTGTKYKLYPTYDFACPIVDSIEGITHALRTSEYLDRDAQYYWFCDALKIRKPIISAYSRLNLMNTVLSKRKLTYFVEQGIIDGWDDPRMPTVRGVLRRGLTVEGLKQFIASQGSSKSVVVMDWDKIWSFNRKVIDPEARRYSGVEKEDMVVVLIEDDVLPTQTISVSLHPKNPDLGQRDVRVGKRLLIDQTDAQLIEPNTSVTFINWGNLKILSVERNQDGKVIEIKAKLDLENKDFKKTLKVTWLEESAKIPALLIYYDNIIKKPVLSKDDDFKQFLNLDSKMVVGAYVDQDLSQLAASQFIQIQRKGFFICDRPCNDSQSWSDHSKLIHLISVPDGTTDLNIFPKSVQNWKKRNVYIEPAPTAAETKKTSSASFSNLKIDQLDDAIRKQGDRIRILKNDKASKEVITVEVAKLLELKNDFSKRFNVSWTPDYKPAQQKALSISDNSGDGSTVINQKIIDQGDLIRKLKSEKADSKTIEEQVQVLLKLKNQFKQATGSDWVPPSEQRAQSSSKKSKSSGGKENKIPQKASSEVDSGGGAKNLKKQTRLGMETKKGENYSEWYTEVITKSEMIEYYDVSGCYILRPWAYAIWETIQQHFDQRIKSIGVQNCYFPMFISRAALETEKTHIADFAPEVAWVTKSGSSDLAEPIAIRPTSETVMYPSYAKWVQSYRDLPIRLNQWCNVVRWEFKQPTPFLRTREFLWQEGHTAFPFQPEALDEMYTILDFYAEIYEQLLAIPVIKGKKTEKEKFAGGDITTTCEAYVHVNGRGIQGATSHHLGQNFSKMFEMVFEDPNQVGKKLYAYQNSWGLSTRTIGAMIMIHGDDKGLVLPPRVASKQVVIVPCGIQASSTDQDKKKLVDACKLLDERLRLEAGIKVQLDISDHHSPGWKFNHWELKGVPIRIELGPKDLASSKYVAVRRDTGEKLNFDLAMAVVDVPRLLDQIQKNLFERTSKLMYDNLVVTESWSTFLEHLEQKAIIMAPFCGETTCEDQIKKDSAKEDVNDASGGPLMGAKSLCIPLKQPKPLADQAPCVYPQCKRLAKYYTLFGRSY